MNNKQNIVYILQSLSEWGGLNRIEADKLNGLAATGKYNVSVICLCQRHSSENVYPLSDKVRQICLAQIFDPKQSPFKRPLRFFLGWWRWRRQSEKRLMESLDALHPDIVVVTINHIPNGFCRIKAKTVIECHGSLTSIIRDRLMPLYSRITTRRNARHATAVATLTHDDAALWTTARRVEVIPNFTNISPSAPCDYRSRHVVTLGRLVPEKGYDMLIDAWKIVAEKHSEWHLDLYGSGGGKNSLQQQINALGLTHQISIHPFTNDITSAYASAAFYVMSSRQEGFPLVLIEAMRCGLPCVSFDCPSGPREIITHGRDGILVPYRGLSRKERVDGLAQALCRMMDHEEELPVMGRAAQETAQRYNADNVIPMWERLFDSL